MAKGIAMNEPKGRLKGVTTISYMPRFLKKLQPSLVQISMTIPQYNPPCLRNQKAAYRCGAVIGASSVLALDYTLRKASFELDSEPRGLRDDWISIGDDLRIVTERMKRQVEHDELPQGQLTEHVGGD